MSNAAPHASGSLQEDGGGVASDRASIMPELMGCSYCQFTQLTPASHIAVAVFAFVCMLIALLLPIDLFFRKSGETVGGCSCGLERRADCVSTRGGVFCAGKLSIQRNGHV
jgi:hypothetical protein